VAVWADEVDVRLHPVDVEATLVEVFVEGEPDIDVPRLPGGPGFEFPEGGGRGSVEFVVASVAVGLMPAGETADECLLAAVPLAVRQLSATARRPRARRVVEVFPRLVGVDGLLGEWGAALGTVRVEASHLW
jgi:hypothetical protein